MNRIRKLSITAAVFALTACSMMDKPVPPPAAPPPPANPFFEASPLPLQAPQFDRIKDSDYQPAIEEGMKRELADMEAIANDPAAPTFDNTIVAMEKAGALLTRVQLVFNAVTGADTNDTLQKVQEDEAPRLAAHHDAIYLNDKLFKRVKAIYDTRETLNSDPEARKLVDVYYTAFVHAGAQLNDADKAKLMDINKQLSMKETSFENKLLAGTKAGALVVDDKSKLTGLSDGAIAAAAQAAEARGLKGKFVVSAAEHDAATRAAVVERSRHAAGIVRTFLDAHREGRCQRYARHDLDHRATPRPKGRVAGVSELCRLCA